VPLVSISSKNTLTIALAEIHAGKVVVKPPGEAGDDPEVKPGAKTAEPRLTDEDLLGGDLFGIAAEDEMDEDLEDNDEDDDEDDEDDPDDEDEPESQS